MAFGFSPHHAQDYALETLTEQQFLVIALEAAKKLNWEISYISRAGFIAHTRFSIGSSAEEIKVSIENGIAHLRSECTGSQMADWGKNKKNIHKLVDEIEALKSDMNVEALSAQYETLHPDFPPEEEDILTQPPPTTKEKIGSFFAIFKPVEGYFITPILIDLNILLFILMAVSGVNILQPDTDSLIKWGANFRPLTLGGQPWRLITNCFLHIGILHLLLNMYALLYIGFLLEHRLGKSRFLAAYLLTGITASVTSLWWHDTTVSAGASGAIFGMYGVFLALLTTNLVEKTARKDLLSSIVVFVGYNLLYGMKGGIDNAAHIGGLIGGIVIGYAFIPSLRKPENGNLKSGTLGALTVVVLCASFWVYRNTSNDVVHYDARMKDFTEMESMALEIYKMPENTPNDKLLAELKNRGIYYWQENLKLIKGLDTLRLPEVLRERDEKLLKYCELRLASYELLYKAISEDTDRFNDSIEHYNHEIQSIIDELGKQ